jgi:hypothetical protein
MLFSLPPGTEMFHFPGFPPHALYIQARVTPHDGCRVPPFGHPRIKALSATPRGLSRPDTSFIGSWYQGIHRAPLNTYTQRTTRTTRCSHPLSSSQTPHRTPNPPWEPPARRNHADDVDPGSGPGPEETHHIRGIRTLRPGFHCGCPFRTQQCARPTPLPAPHRGGPYSGPGCLRCFHP